MDQPKLLAAMPGTESSTTLPSYWKEGVILMKGFWKIALETEKFLSLILLQSSRNAKKIVILKAAWQA